MKSQNCRRRGNFFNNHHRHCCPGGDNRPDARAGRPGVADHQLGDQHGEEGLAEPGHLPPQGDAGGADQRKCTVRCVRIIWMRGVVIVSQTLLSQHQELVDLLLNWISIQRQSFLCLLAVSVIFKGEK